MFKHLEKSLHFFHYQLHLQIGLSKLTSLSNQNLISTKSKNFTIFHHKYISDFQRQHKFGKFFCTTTNPVSVKTPPPKQQNNPKRKLSHELLNQYRAILDQKKTQQHIQKEELLYERPTGSGMILFNTLFTLAAVRSSSLLLFFILFVENIHKENSDLFFGWFLSFLFMHGVSLLFLKNTFFSFHSHFLFCGFCIVSRKQIWQFDAFECWRVVNRNLLKL